MVKRKLGNIGTTYPMTLNSCFGSHARLSGFACKSRRTAKVSTAREMLATGANIWSRADAVRLMKADGTVETKQA
jgi:hypothetical protein